MVDSAALKLRRAEEHIRSAERVLKLSPPFRYMLETNHDKRQRATYAKGDEAAAADFALLCGDALHNIRSALDHVYWDLVSPHVDTKHHRKIQFPFSDGDAASFNDAARRVFAHQVPGQFFDKLLALRPYKIGGDSALYMTHALDIVDKHKLLIPIGDFTTFSSATLRQLVPDFPPLQVSSFTFGGNGRDVVWNFNGGNRQQRRAVGKRRVLEVPINIPVGVVIKTDDATVPVIDALSNSLAAARNAVVSLRQ